MKTKSEGVRPLRAQRGLTPFGFRPDRVLDCYGLLCPVPVRKTAQALEELPPGAILQVIATDEWFGPDLQAWLRGEPHELLALEAQDGEIRATLRKRY